MLLSFEGEDQYWEDIQRGTQISLHRPTRFCEEIIKILMMFKTINDSWKTPISHKVVETNKKGDFMTWLAAQEAQQTQNVLKQLFENAHTSSSESRPHFCAGTSVNEK